MVPAGAEYKGRENFGNSGGGAPLSGGNFTNFVQINTFAGARQAGTGIKSYT